MKCLLASALLVATAAGATPLFKERFEANGDESGGGTPEDFAELIRKDSLRWADVVKRSGARID